LIPARRETCELAARLLRYPETEADAQAFAADAGLLGHEADPMIAQVTTYCLD
jgi:hypothetical protein